MIPIRWQRSQDLSYFHFLVDLIRPTLVIVHSAKYNGVFPVVFSMYLCGIIAMNVSRALLEGVLPVRRRVPHRVSPDYLFGVLIIYLAKIIFVYKHSEILFHSIEESSFER